LWQLHDNMPLYRLQVYICDIETLKMDFLPPEIEAYALAHTSPESPQLQALNRATHLRVLNARMLSGHLQGRVLAMISQMMRPRAILEIGTYTGYSALCLAEGLLPDGKLITIDINEELEQMVRSQVANSAFANQIDLRIGNALDIIPTLTETFDLVFIDADKPSYAKYFELVIDRVRPGGFILADNVLWSGKVAQTAGKIDKDTRNMLDFNAGVLNDPRVENVLLPIRDGIMVARKL
jgi:predicted O-methyltransferase YrrM